MANHEGSKAGSKVDDIWAKLKASQGAGKPAVGGVNLEKLWQGFSSDPKSGKIAAKQQPNASKVQQPTGTADSTARQAACDTATVPQPAPGRGVGDGGLGGSTFTSAGSTAASGSLTAVKPSPEAAQQLVARYVAGLKDSSQSTRRKALQDIKANLVDNPLLGEAWLTERLEGDGLGKALLRRFDDPPDSCREMAVTSLLALLQAAPQAVLSLLPYAVPVLCERLLPKEEGSKSLTEPCEEVRLALVRLLRALVALGGKSFGAYVGDAVAVLQAVCDDPFHEVQEESCAVLIELNDALGPRLHPVAKQLVAAVMPLTTAKRHKVRIAALRALRPTMHQGAHEMILEMVAWRDPNVIAIKAFYGDDLKVNFCGKLAADPHPAVRREFLAVLADWMTGLRERLDHEARLLPFVLSALNDEVPEIQADAVGLLERLGVQYEQDHEKDLKETLPYLPEEAHGIGWQAPGAAGYVYGSASQGEETVNGGRAVFVLPGPLTSRPRLGTRRLVQSNFSRIVGALSEEVTSWMLEARRRAAALLRTQLVLVEEWSEQHLHLVMPALVKAITDPEVRPAIRDCCAIVGAFTDPELALQLLGPRVGDEAADVGQRAAALEVLACVVRGAGPRRALDGHLPAVLQLLSLEPLLTSEDTRVRRALREVVQQLVDTCGPACHRHAADLLWVCLHLRAPGRAAAAAPALPGLPPGLLAAAPAGGAPSSEAEGAGGEGEVEALVQRMAEVCGCAGGADELVEAHRVELLDRVQPGNSPNVQLVTGVLCRLMLPYAVLSYLMLAPEELLARTLPAEGPVPDHLALLPPPTQPSPAPEDQGPAGACMDIDTKPQALDVSAGGQLFWARGSTAAVGRKVCEQVPWLPRHPRCAAMVVLCLEACLWALPRMEPTGPVEAAADAAGDAEMDGGSGQGGGVQGGAEAATGGASGLLLDAVEGLLGSCQELPAPALLGALRCLHVAVSRGLVDRGALAGRLPVLVKLLGACTEVCGSALCRLQACDDLGLLLRRVCSGGEGGAEAGDGVVAVGGMIPSACGVVSARLYDAADEVRCAALRLGRQLVGLAGSVEQPGGEAASAVVERLLQEVVQLKDVAPGSVFFEEYQAFRQWVTERVPGR